MDILTAKQAADELGVSVKTIRARCIRGDFPAKKIGRGWLILQSVLHDYMKGVYDKKDEPMASNVKWQSTNVVKRGISSSRATVSEYDNLLKRPTNKKH